MPGALSACIATVCAQELQKALDETREWVEHLMEELDTSQALVLSLRRELQTTKQQAAAASAS